MIVKQSIDFNLYADALFVRKHTRRTSAWTCLLQSRTFFGIVSSLHTAGCGQTLIHCLLGNRSRRAWMDFPALPPLGQSVPPPRAEPLRCPAYILPVQLSSLRLLLHGLRF